MAIYQDHHDFLVIKCDSCKRRQIVARNQTDITIAHEYMRMHGWQTLKINDKWINLCPWCKHALEEHNRERFLHDLASKYLGGDSNAERETDARAGDP